MAKQREKRYQTAEELQRALHKFLYAFHPEFNPSDLSYYAKDLFKNEIVEDRKKIQKLNEKVEQLISSSADPSAPGNSSNAVDKTKREEDATVVDSNQKANSSDNQKATAATHQKIETLEIEALPPSRTPEMPTNRSHTSYSPKFGSQQISAPIQRRANTKPQSSSSFIRLIAVSAVALIVASIFGPEFGFKVPVLSDSFGNWIGGSEARIVLEGHYKGVKVAVNGETVANKIPATLGGLTVGTLNRISVSGPQGSFQQEITLRKGEKKVITVVLNHTQNEVSRDVSAAHSNEPLTSVATSSSKSILLRLNISPAGGSPNIQVNGKYLDSRSPTIQVPLDAPLELSIDRNGYKTLKREFVLESNSMNGLKEWLMDIQMDPLKFGLLTIHTTPSADATIMIEGSPWKKKTPIENEKIAIGDYSIRLSNDVLGMEKNVNVTIQEGKSVTLDERLEIRN